MRTRVGVASVVWVLVACGGAQQPLREAGQGGEKEQVTSGSESPRLENSVSTRAAKDAKTGEGMKSAEDSPQEFQIVDGKGSAKSAHGVKASVIKGTETEAALKFFVIDKDKGPIPGIVIALAAPQSEKLYTAQTDADGYTEVLVPIGRTYELTYLSLGRRDVAARVMVSDKPKQNIKLTMRYKRIDPPAPNEEPRFVLDGVYFDTGSARVRPESFARLDSVVEYMTHKPSARIEIAGHTDNAGNPKANKALSQKRAQACRDYLSQKGIDASRIMAIGYGDERPIASNDTPTGREQNRRIEAKELPAE